MELNSSPIIVFLTFLLRSNQCSAANILGIFAAEGKSHFYFHKSLMETLNKAGHRVTFVSPYLSKEPADNFTYIDSLIERTETQKLMESDFKSMSVVQAMRTFSRMNLKYCRDFMRIKEIQDLYQSKAKVYDLMIVEMLFVYECYLPLAKHLGIPVIGTFTQRSYRYVDETFGNVHPLVFPANYSPFPKKMTLFQRLQNVIDEVYADFTYKYVTTGVLNEFMSEFFPNYDVGQYRVNELALLFTNTHASIFPAPLVPNIIEVGGLHLPPVKPLPDDLEKFINDAENGVILFTLGSIMKSNVIDARLREIFRHTFAALPQKVIWKFEDPVENLPKNVFLSKWVPQRDILTHKNVKAFITHCGMSGMYEAIDAGVPLIMLPVFMDQFPNAEFLHEMEVGIRLSLERLNKESLSNAINTVLLDEKYSTRMKKLSKEFWDRPMSPQESVVYWTEYVLRYNGTKHLKSVLADMPLYQYLLLDFVLLISVIIFIIIFTLWYSCNYIRNLNMRRKSSGSTKIKKQ